LLWLGVVLLQKNVKVRRSVIATPKWYEITNELIEKPEKFL